MRFVYVKEGFIRYKDGHDEILPYLSLGDIVAYMVEHDIFARDKIKEWGVRSYLDFGILKLPLIETGGRFA